MLLLFFADEERTPPVFEALALRFEKYFLFTKMIDPSQNDLNSIGLGDRTISPPELFVLLATSGDPESARAVRFDPKMFGGMNYTKIMEFLFSVNGKFRHELPGANLAGTQQEAEMADIVAVEAKRFKIVHGTGGHDEVDIPSANDIFETDNLRFKVTKETVLRDEL